MVELAMLALVCLIILSNCTCLLIYSVRVTTLFIKRALNGGKQTRQLKKTQLLAQELHKVLVRIDNDSVFASASLKNKDSIDADTASL